MRARDFLTNQDRLSPAPTAPGPELSHLPACYEWAEALPGRHPQHGGSSGGIRSMPRVEGTLEFQRDSRPTAGLLHPRATRTAGSRLGTEGSASVPVSMTVVYHPLSPDCAQEELHFDPFYLLFYSQCRGPCLTHRRRPINICK